jgi:hypothetical protein
MPQYSPNLRVDVPTDAPDYLHSLVRQLQTELKNISVNVKSTNTSVMVVSADVATALTGGTGTTASTVKAGLGVVTAGTAAWIDFPVGAFTSKPTITLCFVASSSDAGFGTINTKNLVVTKAGFNIPADEIMFSGSIFYVAVLN